MSLKDLCLIIGWGALHTLIITPDLNWNSTPNKLLGPVGWILRKTIKSHRGGVTHSYFTWSLYFIITYFVIGWWTLSGVLPIFSHLFLDKNLTKLKKTFHIKK